VDGEIVIRINHETVADLDTSGGSYRGSVNLNGGEWVPVELSFIGNGGSNAMIFGWQPPGQKWELVPRKYLSPVPLQACCAADFDHDCDVDGQDLADVSSVLELGLATFADSFGRSGCQ
jgi:hypothetical protein